MKTTIAIVAWGAGADILYATPIVRKIREENPCAHITWIVRDIFADLVATNPYIDAVKEVYLPSFEKDKQSNEYVMDQMAHAIATSPTYDKCYYLQYWPRFTNFYENPNEDFISLRARNAGIDPSSIKDRRPILMVTDADKKAVDDKFSNLDWSKVITCNHISYAASPCWSFAQYGDLAIRLKDVNLNIMFTGAHHERIPTISTSSTKTDDLNREIEVYTDAIDARGLPFRQWAKCISRSSLWLGLDSGAVAFACSTNVPIIKLHSPDFPIRKTGIKAMGLRTDDKVLELCPAPSVETVFNLIMKMRRQ